MARLVWPLCALFAWTAFAETRVYENQLVPIRDPQPLLADHPRFVEPVRETRRFEAPAIIDEPDGDLDIRAWRFSYNARGVIEIPNRIRGSQTAVVCVHPWGIDDEWGWRSPEPAGVAFQCTPEKNKLLHEHVTTVLEPFLKRMRPVARTVVYSLPGVEDPIRRKIYRSVRARTTAQDRTSGTAELKAKLKGFNYSASPIEASLRLSSNQPVADYFKQFPGLDAYGKRNGAGFWDLPIPVTSNIDVALDDVVIYDAEGYGSLRDFLKEQGVRNVLLTGYNTDMCYCLTTAGYKNLKQDFNVFLVGDCTVATFPANPEPRFATNASISFASLENLITQASWVRPRAAVASQKASP